MNNKTRQTWSDMLQRCYNPNSRQFKNYGARGIKVCSEWRYSFENFLADMGERPAGLTIERINNYGHYTASNCRWATRLEQRRNQRRNRVLTFNGKSQTVEEWSRELGIHPETLRTRLRIGWDVETTLTFPPSRRNGPLASHGKLFAALSQTASDRKAMRDSNLSDFDRGLSQTK